MKTNRITAIIFFLLLTAHCYTQVCFEPFINFATGSATLPWSITSGDFNGDGFADLATANQNSGSVSILMGTGTGSFDIATNVVVGYDPESIISADFNGDNFDDLAVSSANSFGVYILLSAGISGFNTAITTVATGGSASIISADFNGDHFVDLALTHTNSNDISILLGNGAGSFSSTGSFAAAVNPGSIISTDFNGDSFPDLAVTIQNPTSISVLLGTGTGSFSSAINFTVGSTATHPYSITSADFNEDGKADIALVQDYSTNVEVFLGLGNGNFNTATNYMGTGGLFIINSDFNGDGKKDLVLPSFPNVSVLLGDGAGNFGTPINFTAGNRPQSIINADFNKDGKMDLATANADSNNISVLLNCTAQLGVEPFARSNEEVMVYPNPVKNSLQVTVAGNSKIQSINLYDVLGNELIKKEELTIQNVATQVDVSSLQNGIYFISVRTDEGLVSKKIIIQR